MDFEALLANGDKPDQEVAISLAYKLYHLDGFKKTDIAPYIEKKYVRYTIISTIMFSEVSEILSLHTQGMQKSPYKGAGKVTNYTQYLWQVPLCSPLPPPTHTNPTHQVSIVHCSPPTSRWSPYTGSSFVHSLSSGLLTPRV